MDIIRYALQKKMYGGGSGSSGGSSGGETEKTTLAKYAEGLLTEITPKDLQGATSIGAYGLYYSNATVSIELPNTVTNIETYAFAYCYNLETLIIPSSVTKIDSMVVENCSKLAKIDYKGQIEDWLNIDLHERSRLFDKGANFYINGEKATNIIIPVGVININNKGNNAFNKCTSIESVEFENGVTRVAYQMFYSCTSLTSAVMPNTITSISDYAFAYCTSLTSITIPASVTSIGSHAFNIGSTDNKATVTILATKPPYLYNSAGIGANVGKIIVPKGCLSAYQSATNWSAKASIMEEATE